MAIITNIPALNTKQITSLSEALFQAFFNDPALTSMVNVQEGIKVNTQLLIFDRHTGLSGKKITACPTPTNTTLGLNVSEKTWTPTYIGDRFAECWTVLQGTCLQWMLKNGIEKQDLTATEYAAFLEEQLQDTIAEVFQRIFWFGDAGIVAGTGNNLAAGEVAFFNMLDGIFAQLFDIVTATPARLSTTGISTVNAGVSYAAQKFSAADVTNQVVSKALDSVWYDASIKLRSVAKSDLMYLVTQSVQDQWEKERKAVSGLDLPYMRQENGQMTATWNGIQVMPVQLWDRMIASYFGDDAKPVKSTLPHRVILVPKNNLLLGVETVGAMGELEIFHDKVSRSLIADYGASMDAKIGINEMIQATY
jgi:hypothetical protein